MCTTLGWHGYSSDNNSSTGNAASTQNGQFAELEGDASDVKIAGICLLVALIVGGLYGLLRFVQAILAELFKVRFFKRGVFAHLKLYTVAAGVAVAQTVMVGVFFGVAKNGVTAAGAPQLAFYMAIIPCGKAGWASVLEE